jgi:hypothetical protein
MSKVQVLCKLPHGLFCELDLVFDPVTHTHIKGPNYAAVRLNGTNSNRIMMPNSFVPVVPIDAPPGVTEVDEDFIMTWLARNKTLQFVKIGLITVVKPDDVKAASRDLEQHRHGAEALDPNKIPVKGVTARDNK